MSFAKLSAFLAASLAVTGAMAQYYGQATYYYQNGQPGACGIVHSDYDLIVALDTSIFNSDLCGDSIWLYNPDNGNTFTVIVADECPGCGGASNIDLSVGAFEQLSSDGGLDAGVLPVEWNFYTPDKRAE